MALKDPLIPPARRPTIKDIAQTAGLSVATVDRVINRRAPVAPETARQVLEAARRLDYHATKLVQRRLDEAVDERTFGFLLQRQSGSFYKALANELRRATRQLSAVKGRATIEFLDDLAPGRVAEAVKRLSRSCDALALVAADHPRIAEAVGSVVGQGKPVFLLLSDITSPLRTGFLGIDHRQAGRTAAWAVSRLGRRLGPVGIMIGNHRYLGHELCEMSFRSYLREHGPEIRVLDAVLCLEDPRLAHESTLDLLGRHPDLRGLYVAGGGMEGVIGALREHGDFADLVVICNELIPETREALIDGVVDLVIATPVALLADRAVAAMTDALLGRAHEAPKPEPLRFGLHCAENL